MCVFYYIFYKFTHLFILSTNFIFITTFIYLFPQQFIIFKLVKNVKKKRYV